MQQVDTRLTTHERPDVAQTDVASQYLRPRIATLIPEVRIRGTLGRHTIEAVVRHRDTRRVLVIDARDVAFRWREGHVTAIDARAGEDRRHALVEAQRR